MSETTPAPDSGSAAETRPPARRPALRITNPLQYLRPPFFHGSGYHDFGLKGALSDRILPILTAAMTVLAALAWAGFVGASALAQHWQQGAEATLTVQVPRPDALAPPELALGTPASTPAALPANKRIDRAMAVLRDTPGIASVKLLTEDELAALLRPWLGTAVAGIALPMPAVIDVRLSEPPPEMTSLAARLDAAAPGTLTESHGTWVRRLVTMARSLQACTGAALLLVSLVAAAMVAVATRAGVANRREAIEIVHGLGATDTSIARPFAWRAMMMAALGSAAGVILALPVLLWLTDVVAPFSAVPPTSVADFTQSATTIVAAVPTGIWLGLLIGPPTAALIGWAAAYTTVRHWLRQLP